MVAFNSLARLPMLRACSSVCSLMRSLSLVTRRGRRRDVGQRAVVVAFATDADGVLWALRQSSQEAIHGRWRRQRKGRVGRIGS
jgi:hypothetical protein